MIDIESMSLLELKELAKEQAKLKVNKGRNQDQRENK